ncbi:MAG: sigma-70 family RNA polymerase sigma factor [Phycisphaerae bacterium]|nr:sigma-70 family RNA polymerase sigma factor [Phycisphaerae bacterium]
MTSLGENNLTERFLQQLMANQQRIYAYILTLVPHVSDADDIMQQVTMVMWHKFEQFAPGGNFFSWGAAIAHNKVLDFRRKQARSKMRFDDDLLQLFEKEIPEATRGMQAKISALEKCMENLSIQQRDILRDKYENGKSVKILSGDLGKSSYSIYRELARIHGLLLRCINRRLICE